MCKQHRDFQKYLVTGKQESIKVYIINQILIKLNSTILFMNSIKLIVAFLLLVFLVQTSKVNTTQFFEQKVGHSFGYETYSGYQNIDWYYPNGTAAMYYSFFQGVGKHLNDKNVPLIVYVEGGPGYSSQWSAFDAVGPLSIEKTNNTFSVSQNGWAWSIYGHMVFVDQPLQVGFSYNKNKRVDNTYDASHHFLNFLYNFLEEWDLKENPLYIAGTSYAGHYIPVFARNIMTNMSLGFNLKGVIIGGPWVDPVTQLNFMDSFMYSVGIVSQSGRSTTASMQNLATIKILNGKYASAGQDINWIQDQGIIDKFFGGVDFQNFRSYQFSNSHYDEFLQINKEKLGVPGGVNYKIFNRDIFNAFVASGDYAKSMGDQVDFILNRGLRVLFYSGQNDVVVPTASTLTFLNTIQWHQLSNWQRSSKQPFEIVHTKAGWVKKHGNFVFAFLKDAGHSAPVQQPRACLQMVNNFIHNIW